MVPDSRNSAPPLRRPTRETGTGREHRFQSPAQTLSKS